MCLSFIPIDFSQNYAVLSYVFNSIPMPESYQYIRNLERLGAKIPSTILVYFWYHTELKSQELGILWISCGLSLQSFQT